MTDRPLQRLGGTRWANEGDDPAAQPREEPATERSAPRPTTHTFEQVNWANIEQETRIGVLQEMVAILLNRLDEREAAAGALPSVEAVQLLRDMLSANHWYIAHVNTTAWIDSTEWGPILEAELWRDSAARLASSKEDRP